MNQFFKSCYFQRWKRGESVTIFQNEMYCVCPTCWLYFLPHLQKLTKDVASSLPPHRRRVAPLLMALCVLLNLWAERDANSMWVTFLGFFRFFPSAFPSGVIIGAAVAKNIRSRSVFLTVTTTNITKQKCDFIYSWHETWEQTEMVPGFQLDWIPSRTSFCSWWQRELQRFIRSQSKP